MHATPELDRRVAGVAALDQPLRRQLYRLLAGGGDWITRDEAAARLDVPRSVAAFHLDKLAEAGLVDVRFERTGGRQGPGAGRPSKLYRRRDEEVTASVPDRRYDLAGSLLLEAVAEADRTGEPVGRVLADRARDRGHRLAGEGRTTLEDLLERNGYEPRVDASGEIALANCPFHLLAEQDRALVCSMNLDFVRGLLDGLEGAGRLTARLAPQPGYCCVRISAAWRPAGRCDPRRRL
jgi:predicted ArsR family transcriptional regulator